MRETKLDLNEIITFFRKELQKDSSIITFNDDKEVTIKALDRNLQEVERHYQLPDYEAKDKEAADKLHASLTEIFDGCFDYLKQKLNSMGTTIFEDGNRTIIDGEDYHFNDKLEYIDFLETKLEKKLKNKKVQIPSYKNVEVLDFPKKEENISVKESTITLSPYSNSNYKLTEPLSPLGQIKVTSHIQESEMNLNESEFIEPKIKHEAFKPKEENKPIEIKEPEEKPIKQKKSKRKYKVNYDKFNMLKQTQMVSQKLNDDEVLSKKDCEILRNKEIVFVPVSMIDKNDITFLENIDIMNQVIPDTLAAAFVSGKVTNIDKITKEALKIAKLCSGINSGILCYEINNDAFRNMTSESEIFESFKAVEQLASALTTYGFSPLICADLDNREKINDIISKVDPNYVVDYPVLTRISSKQLDDVETDMNLVVMHPQSDTDEIILNDAAASYVRKNVQKNIKNKISSKAA